MPEDDAYVQRLDEIRALLEKALADLPERVAVVLAGGMVSSDAGLPVQQTRLSPPYGHDAVNRWIRWLVSDMAEATATSSPPLLATGTEEGAATSPIRTQAVQQARVLLRDNAPDLAAVLDAAIAIETAALRQSR